MDVLRVLAVQDAVWYGKVQQALCDLMSYVAVGAELSGLRRLSSFLHWAAVV